MIRVVEFVFFVMLLVATVFLIAVFTAATISLVRQLF